MTTSTERLTAIAAHHRRTLAGLQGQTKTLPPGPPGADGATVLNGSGPPAPELGANGDFYLDTAAATIYGPKAAGTWGSATGLTGPTGALGRFSPNIMRPATGLVLGNGILGNTLTSVAQVANRVTIAPYVPGYDITVDQLGCSISVVVAAPASVKLVLYASDADGRPTTILRETADIDAAVTTGTKLTDITPISLAAGTVYWLGLRSQSNPTIRTVNSAAAAALTWSTGSTPVMQTTLTKSEPYATPAADWTYGAGHHSNLAPPLILMRTA